MTKKKMFSTTGLDAYSIYGNLPQSPLDIKVFIEFREMFKQILEKSEMENEIKEISYEEYLKLGDDYALLSHGDAYEELDEYFDTCESAISPDDLPDWVIVGKRKELPGAEELFNDLIEALENTDSFIDREECSDWCVSDDLDKEGFIEAIKPWLEKQKLNFFVYADIRLNIKKEKEAYFKEKRGEDDE